MNWHRVQYYYDYDRLLQFQTDLHFKYVTELSKYILTKVFAARRCRSSYSLSQPPSRILY